jgi:hypothetical protein
MNSLSPAVTRMTVLIVLAQDCFVDSDGLGWAVDRYWQPQ